MKIDGSSFKVSDNKYIHKFIFDPPLKGGVVGRLLEGNESMSGDGTSMVV